MSPRSKRARRPLVVYGAGDHGLVVAEAAAAGGWHVIGFLDDQPAHSQLGDWSVLPIDSPLMTEARAGAGVIVAIGDNMARRRLSGDLVNSGWKLVNVIHPAAWVSPTALLGTGVFVGAQAVVNAQARIDDGVIVNSGAVVEHHCHIHAFAHVAPRTAMGGRVTVGLLSLVGVGAAILPGLTVGQDCVVGAGATVVADVPDGAKVVGTPARRMAKG